MISVLFSPQTGTVLYVFTCILIIMGTWSIVREIKDARIHTEAVADQMVRELKGSTNHQTNWLFEQLCNQTPGKIKLPNEIEEDSTNEPAKVYSPSEDPLNKLSGQVSDWHG